MGCPRVVVFNGVCRSWEVIYKVALINVFVFEVSKILHNLVFVQKSYSKITGEVSVTSKSAQSGIAFISNVGLETVNVLA